MNRLTNSGAALAFAGVLAIGATMSASAGPLPTSTAGVKNAATDHVTDVRWRGRHWGPGIAAGIAAGALFGAAVASRPYYGGPGYYVEEPSYYYEAPVAAVPYPYSYGPTYYGYGWGRYNCGGSIGQNRDCAYGDTGR